MLIIRSELLNYISLYLTSVFLIVRHALPGKTETYQKLFEEHFFFLQTCSVHQTEMTL